MTGIIDNLKYLTFERHVQQMLCVNRTIYIYTSPYFRCGLIFGFPVAFCLCPDICKAWLVPADSLLSEEPYRKKRSAILKAIADFGIRNCSNENDLLNILQELGAERVGACVSDDDWHSMFDFDMRRRRIV